METALTAANVSSSLADDPLHDVQRHLDAIRHNRARQLVLRIENGWHCIQIKRILGHGNWLNFILDGNVGYTSARTIERDMALAEALYEQRHLLLDSARYTSAAAMLVLARFDDNDADMNALDVALALMQRGVRVTEAAARALAQVCAVLPDYANRVAIGEISLENAMRIAEAYRQHSADADIGALIQQHAITQPDVVAHLAALKNRQPDEFAALVASGVVHHPLLETPIPLARASAGDLEMLVRYADTEREARRQEHINNWRARKPAPLLDTVGSRADVRAAVENALADADPTIAYRVVIYSA